jgi:uncharacterized protein YggE
MYAGSVGQSIERPVGLNVFGSCLLGVEPDYADIRCSVARVAESPAPAFEGARAKLDAVRGVFREAKVETKDLQISRIDLTPAYEGDYNKRRFVGYTGAAELVVLVRDLGGIEALLQAIVDAGALIDGVSYKTTRLVELRNRARAGAVEAARRKAEAYAAAAGVRLGSPLHLEDVNPERLGRGSHAPDIDFAAESEAESVVGSIRIAGAVMVCYAILGAG